MTLVEVVGGLGLLATLLVAVLLAKGRYTRQAATADRRLGAVAAAATMLTAWHQDSASLPHGAGVGVVPGDGGFSWRTQRVANAAIDEMDAQVVRLEILDSRPQAIADPVLTWVEFVVESEATKRKLENPQNASRRKRPAASVPRSQR